MRTTLLGNNNTPENPGTKTFLSVLPSDLRAVMKSASKYTYNDGKITATKDYLTLLSEFEAFGLIGYSDAQEENYQKQYNYYASGNPANPLKFNGKSVENIAVCSWCRSVCPGASSFCALYDGTPTFMDSFYSKGISPIFFI